MLGRWCTAGLVALLAMLMSASCGHEATPDSSPNPTAGGLPDLPTGTPLDLSGAIPKKVLLDLDLDKKGKDAMMVSISHLEGTDLVLTPSAEFPISWAIFQYSDVAPYYSVNDVRLELKGLDDNADNHCFVGFADYSSQTWRLQPIPGNAGPDQAGYYPVTVAVPAGDFLPTSNAGTAYIAVITMGRDLTIGSCTLEVSENAPAPLGLEASDRTLEAGIKLTWMDPAVSFDPDGQPGGLEFEYDYVRIERRAYSQGDMWETIATIPNDFTEYRDLDPTLLPTWWYEYRLRTVVEGQPGNAGASEYGEIGMRPTADFEASGTAPDLLLDPSASFDSDGSNVIAEYHWTVSYPEVPGFDYDFITNTPDPFMYSLTDLTKINRIDLTVVDDEGFFSNDSQGWEATSEPFYLFSPNLGCIQDNPSQPDPVETIDGYGAMLYFEVSCGNPTYRYELDSNFDGTFGPTDGVPVVLLKDFPTAPNVDGNISTFANIPVAQPYGDYYFAVRVTEGSGAGESWIYMWPDRVTLAP